MLITGETGTGTGKDLLAQLVHRLGNCRGDFTILDCTTLSPELGGSELFGHERGAFTGASGARDGAFALADGGVLFLDEVGELPLPLQAQLLRAIQERKYKRVGGNTWQPTQFRLACATTLPSSWRSGPSSGVPRTCRPAAVAPSWRARKASNWSGTCNSSKRAASASSSSCCKGSMAGASGNSISGR